MKPLAFHLMRMQPWRRLGWVNCISLLLFMAGVLLLCWAIPGWQRQIRHGEGKLAQLRQALEPARASPAAPARQAELPEHARLRQFHALVGESLHVEQQIRTIFALARKAGIRFNQAEYRAGDDVNGRYATLQVALPVHGTYAAIRQFLEQVLLAIPFASLDDIVLSRDTSVSAALDAKLRFTIFLEGGAHGAVLTPMATDGERR